MIDGEILRGTMKYSQAGGGEAQNVFHWLFSGEEAPDGDVLNEMVSFVDDWLDAWQDWADNSSVLKECLFEVVDGVGAVLRTIGVVSRFQNGDGGSGQVAAGVAGLINAPTVGSQRRGKKFVPGAEEDNIFDGVLTDVGLTRLVALGLVYRALYPDQGVFTLVPGVLSVTYQVFRPFTGSLEIDALPAYQRRRKAGVGI